MHLVYRKHNKLGLFDKCQLDLPCVKSYNELKKNMPDKEFCLTLHTFEQ